MNIQSSLVAELKDKTYRDAYVGSQIRMTLPLQIRGVRESFGWKQSELAEKARMAQPRISELETPGERRLTLETLLRIASALDVGLQVRFVPFSELIDWSEGLDLDHLHVIPFLKELEEAASQAIEVRRKHRIGRRRRRQLSTAQMDRGISPILVPSGNVFNYSVAPKANAAGLQLRLFETRPARVIEISSFANASGGRFLVNSLNMATGTGGNLYAPKALKAQQRS